MASLEFQELSPAQFAAARPLFADGLGHIPLLGALEGLHPARVFADDAERPALALVASRWGYFYLGGEPAGEAAAAALGELISRETRRIAEDTTPRGFVLWPEQTGWLDWLPQLLPGRQPLRGFRRTFHFDPITFYENRFSRPPVPPGLRLQAIDAASLEEMEDDLAAEILESWRSLDDFRERGAGACLMDGDRLASVCFAAFAAGGAADASVFTPARYRRRGLATLSAARFVEECLRHDLRPNWETFWDNLPSLKLAENLGFQAQGDVPVVYWEASLMSHAKAQSREGIQNSLRRILYSFAALRLCVRH